MKQKNKVVLITGASSGIGLATARFLHNKGYIVYGTSRREIVGENFNSIVADVNNSQEMDKVFETILKQHGQLDVVVNNAGMGISGAVEHTQKSRVEGIFDVNTIACMDVCAKAVPVLRKNGGGKIINISSVASVFSIPFQAYYSATKSAIEGFSFALANEVKKFNIKICCIRPGDTKTGFTSARVKNEQNADKNYGDKIAKSVAKMEKNEQRGKPPESVSKVIYKTIKRKNPPPVCTVGFAYKTLCLLSKILPTRLVNFLVGKLYG